MDERYHEDEDEIYSGYIDEIRHLLFYSGRLLRRMDKENTLESMTIPELKKTNEFLKNGLLDIQRMLQNRREY